MSRIVLPLYTPRYRPNGNEVAVIATSKGVITVALDGKRAPQTVGNFIELSRRGFYDNLKFHARKPESVILGGCPLTRTLGPAQVDAAARGLVRGIHPGVGDARYTIADEFSEPVSCSSESGVLSDRVDSDEASGFCGKHILGSLCFAHKSEPNSGSSQFYFSLSEQPEFDGRFAVFGSTVEGIEVIQALRVGDAILAIDILHADEEALAEAVSHETPKPNVSVASKAVASPDEADDGREALVEA